MAAQAPPPPPRRSTGGSSMAADFGSMGLSDQNDYEYDTAVPSHAIRADYEYAPASASHDEDAYDTAVPSHAMRSTVTAPMADYEYAPAAASHDDDAYDTATAFDPRLVASAGAPVTHERTYEEPVQPRLYEDPVVAGGHGSGAATVDNGRTYEEPVVRGGAAPAPTPRRSSVASASASARGSTSGPAPTSATKGRVAPPRHCAVCFEFIKAEGVNVKDLEFHGHCFRCENCQRPLQSTEFYNKESKLYCSVCYFRQFGLTCGACGKPLAEKYLSLLGKNWHLECLKCTDCKVPIGEKIGAIEKNGKPYCKQHYLKRFGSKCGRCKKMIEAGALVAGKKKYHTECFVCFKKGCGASLGGGFFAKGSKLYCAQHK